MDTSVGTTAGQNPESNTGNFLQMIKTAGLDKSAAKESGGAVGTDAENENTFLQVLQQKLAVLLQSDQSDSSAEVTAQQKLSAAIEKVLKEGQDGSGEIISGLALLAMVGETQGAVAGENEFSEESFSRLIAAAGMSGISQEETTADAHQAMQAMVRNEKEFSVSKTMELSAEQGIAPGLNAKDQSTEATLQSQTASLKDLQAGVMAASSAKISAEEQAKTALLKSAQDNSAGQVNDVGRQGLAEGTVKTSSIPGNQANTLTGYADVLRKVTAEGKDKAAPSQNAEEMSAAPKASEAKENMKISTAITGAAHENTSRQNLADETLRKEESLGGQNMQDQAGQEVKKKVSFDPDTQIVDKQLAQSFNDAQKNIGKVTTAMPESAGLVDKVKTEFRSKTMTAENNSLNSANVSGISTTKTAISDITPAQIINRVAAEFNEGLLSEGGRVKITLAPPSLGTLEMDVMVHNSKVRVLLTAENQDVQKMLSANLDSLKGSLQGQGLTIERCDVMMQDRREQYSQGFNQQTFNQEHSANQKQPSDNGEPHIPGIQTVTPLIITPKNQATGRSENISIFA